MFKNDLKVGKGIEREFASKLMKRDVSKIEFSEGKFPDWDVKATFHKQGQLYDKTFEIKADFKAETTGNVGIEYMCNGHPSGIYTSKADYIVYHLGDKFYYQDRGELTYRLDKVPYTPKSGGDGNRALLYVVDKKYLSDLFKEL